MNRFLGRLGRGPARLWADQRGLAAVEFAIVVPVLLMIVFGVVELGSAWYSKQIIVNASREGARLGVLFVEGGITNNEVVAKVNEFLENSSFPGSATVVVTGADGTTGDPVTVQVSADHELSVLGGLVPGVPEAVSLSATTVMRHE